MSAGAAAEPAGLSQPLRQAGIRPAECQTSAARPGPPGARRTNSKAAGPISHQWASARSIGTATADESGSSALVHSAGSYRAMLDSAKSTSHHAMSGDTASLFTPSPGRK